MEEKVEEKKEEVKNEEIEGKSEEEEIVEVGEVKKEEVWIPKTRLGKEVLEGKIKSIDEIFERGERVLEYEIIDMLLPDLKVEYILIGGRVGKGGGQQRIPIRITAKITKSGRRFHYSAFAIVGNEDGYIGIGKGRSNEPRLAMEKAVNRAKLNIIKILRGCGSWECKCNEEHSIPYKVEGKSGSVRVILMPAPKGVGLVCSEEMKKILKLAGIKDIWVKTFGNSQMYSNLIMACFNALRKLYVYKR